MCMYTFVPSTLVSITICVLVVMCVCVKPDDVSVGRHSLNIC